MKKTSLSTVFLRFLFSVTFLAMTFLAMTFVGCGTVTPETAEFSDETADSSVVSTSTDDGHTVEVIAETDPQRDAIYFLNCEDLPEEGGWTTPAGDRIILQSNGQWGMIDVGMTYTDVMDEQADRELENLLAVNGGEIPLSFVVITHPHIDHYGYFQDMFREHPGITMTDDFTLYYKYYESDPDTASDTAKMVTEVYDILMETLRERFGDEAESHIQTSDFEPTSLGDFTLTFFNCSAEAAMLDLPNDTSTVTYLQHTNGTDMLLMGDVEKTREAVLLEGELAEISDIDILKAGHHGLATSSGAAFMEQMNPSDVIVTGIDGMYNPADDGSLAYKCLTSGANLYGTYFNTQGISLVFDQEENSYGIYSGFTGTEPARLCTMTAGTLQLKDHYSFTIDDSLQKI